MSYLNCKKMETAISRAKKRLIEKANKQGLYENFGEKEVREIEYKFIDISSYSPNENYKRTLLRNFNNWCMNYTN
jgi:hypothetical protein